MKMLNVSAGSSPPRQVASMAHHSQHQHHLHAQCMTLTAPNSPYASAICPQQLVPGVQVKTTPSTPSAMQPLATSSKVDVVTLMMAMLTT
jgi:hypothetical protein